MDTNSNIPAEKKVVSVEILHLDELGYGPQGTHTRREWRAECLKNFLAGSETFMAWENNLKNQVNHTLSKASLNIKLTYNDGSILFEGYQSNDWRNPVLDFVAHEFKTKLVLSGFRFLHIAKFSRAIFTEGVDFRGVDFAGYADFRDTKFMKDTAIANNEFQSHADFRDSVFTGYADFHSSKFKMYALFEKVKFAKNAYFSGAEFAKYAHANFHNVTFKGDAFFNNAIFSGDANFSEAIFTLDADFRMVNFNADAIYRGSMFCKNANFFKTKFNNQCRFDNEQNDTTKKWSKETQFFGVVNFENAIIENVGHFERTQFKGELPNFLGVDNAKTLLVFSGDEYFNKYDTQGNATDRIAQLKRLADEQGQMDQALMFNAFELNAKRARSMDAVKHLKWWQKLFNGNAWLAWTTYAYDKLSDCGRSFTRPLVVYGMLMLVTLLLAVGHGLWASMDACEREGWNVYEQLFRDQVSCPVVTTFGEQKIPLTVPRAAFEYTAYRASGVLDFVDADKQTIAVANRLFNQPIEPMWMRIWGVLKAIASAALLFLAALGLRNKYRIK